MTKPLLRAWIRSGEPRCSKKPRTKTARGQLAVNSVAEHKARETVIGAPKRRQRRQNESGMSGQTARDAQCNISKRRKPSLKSPPPRLMIATIADGPTPKK